MSEFVDFEIPMDLTEDKTWGGGSQALPDGWYLVEITNVAMKETKKGGNGIAVTFTVTDPDNEQNGRKITNTYSLADNEWTRARLKNLLYAAGNTTFSGVSASMLLGRGLKIEVFSTKGEPTIDSVGDPVEGKTYSNVRNETPLEQQAAEPAAPPPPQKGKPVGAARNGATQATARR